MSIFPNLATVSSAAFCTAVSSVRSKQQAPTVPNAASCAPASLSFAASISHSDTVPPERSNRSATPADTAGTAGNDRDPAFEIQLVHRLPNKSSGTACCVWMPSPEMPTRMLLPELEKLRRPPPHSHAGRSAGGDDISRTQAHELADVRDQMCDAEYHGSRIAVLEALAIDFQP